MFTFTTEQLDIIRGKRLTFFNIIAKGEFVEA